MGRPRKNQPSLAELASLEELQKTLEVIKNQTSSDSFGRLQKSIESIKNQEVSELAQTASASLTLDDLTNSMEENIKQHPPVLFNRNKYGLFNHIEYKFREDGTVDWFKMAPKIGIYIKPLKPEQQQEIEQKIGKLLHEIDPISDGVEEKYLAISLFALRYLAKLRGFLNLRIRNDVANPDYASASCSIDWFPNYESGDKLTTFEATASVVMETTNFMTKSFLVETAANRAEARAIRNFLGINVVSKEEIGRNNASPEDNFEPSNASDPKNILNKKMKDLGINSIEILKEKLEKIGDVSYAEYNSFKDIPKDRYFSLIGLLSKLS